MLWLCCATFVGGILLFFVVEKIVRRYEELSIHSRWGHSHHHQKKKKMSKEPEISQKIAESEDASGSDSKDTKLLESKSSDVKKVPFQELLEYSRIISLRNDGIV